MLKRSIGIDCLGALAIAIGASSNIGEYPCVGGRIWLCPRSQGQEGQEKGYEEGQEEERQESQK